MATMLFITTLKNMTNSRRCTVFFLGTSKFDQKTIFSAKWLNFANFRYSWSENCVFKELINKFKVVYNVVSDNFYFDQNTVQCH